MLGGTRQISPSAAVNGQDPEESKEQGFRPDIHVLKRPKNSGVQKLEFGRFASLQTEHGGVSAELPTDPLSGSLLGRENGA